MHLEPMTVACVLHVLLPPATVFVIARMFTQSLPEELHGNGQKSVEFNHNIFSSLGKSSRV